MSISKKQLEEAREEAFRHGQIDGRAVALSEAKINLQELRKAGLVEICNAVSQLAMANAKLTYAISRVTDKLL